MKKIALILILFSGMLHAQSHYNNYDSLWQEVQQLDKDNLPKSAYTKVSEIFEKAQKENNAPQLVKALMYQSKYALITEEDAQLNVVHNFEKEIEKATFPAKNILESVLAGLYWQYFQQNRWQFYKRTHTAEKVDSSDFRTWDLHTIFQEIDKHFQHSLENGLQAQNTKLEAFNALLHTQEGSKKYRPTLYDFLAQNALEFYKTGESNLPQPAYKFEIENPKLLGSNNDFLSVDLVAKDSTSQKLHALKIFQNLTLLHQKNKDIPALIAVSLERMDFVKENARFSNVNQVYLQGLLDFKKQYNAYPSATEIDYRIALAYQNQANTYKPETDETHRFDLQKALQICEDAIRRFPDSNGATRCKNLKNSITDAAMQISAEKIIIPLHPEKVWLKYKNLDKLYFRILSVSPDDEEKLQQIYNPDKRRAFLLDFPVVHQFETSLKNEKDYQFHTTEIILPEIAQGFYVIVASTESNFGTSSNYAFSFVQATNLALVESKINNSYRYQVVNRNTGRPISGAKVHIRNKNARYSNKPIDINLTSDSQGFVSYQAHSHHNQVEITVQHLNDTGVFRYYRIYKQNDYPNDRHKFHTNTVFLFTDRSIYRPSQTVYFKGIAVAQKENISSV